MADLSSLSNEELLAAIPTADLMKIAGVGAATTPPPVAAPNLFQKALGSSMFGLAAKALPEFKDAAYDIGKNTLSTVAGAGGTVLDILDTLNPLTPKQAVPGEFARAARGLVQEYLPADKYQGPVADVIKAAQGASLFPGAAVENAIAGGAAEVGSQLFPKSDIAPLAFGLLAPSAVRGGANAVAKTAEKVGKVAQRASITQGRQAPYLKSLRESALDTTSPKEMKTQFTASMDRVLEREGAGLNRSPDAVAELVATKLDKYGKEIGAMSAKADAASTPVLAPKFTNTKRLIKESTANEDDLVEAFDFFKDRFSKWDGTIKGMHKWSSDIGKMAFKGAANNESPANVQRMLKRAIRRDLSDAVKENLIKTGSPAEKVKDVFQRYSDLSAMEGVVNENLVKAEGRSVFAALRDVQRTSGGTITAPMMMSAALMGSGVPGAAYGLALTGALSPFGSNILGAGLRNSGLLAKSLFSKTSTADLMKAAAPALASRGGVTDEAAPVAAPEASKAPEEDSMMFLQSLLGDDVSKKKEAPMTEAPKVKYTGPKAEIHSAIDEVAASHEIDPKLLKALAMQESALNPKAVSDKGAIGLTQLMPGTARDIARKLGLSKYDLRDPKTNLIFGATYLKGLIEKYKGDLKLALSAYHSGHGRVDRILASSKSKDSDAIISKLGPIGRRYAKSVLQKMEA